MASAGQRTSSVWVTMLTAPPRLTPGDWSALMTWIGMRTRIVAPSLSRMKSTWTGMVAHGIELEVARDHPVLGAVDLDVVDGGQEPAGKDALAQFGIVERDGERRLVAAVDDAGHAARATFGPGGPLAGPRTRRRLDFLDGRHVSVLFHSQRKRHPTCGLRSRCCSVHEHSERRSETEPAAAAANLQGCSGAATAGL